MFRTLAITSGAILGGLIGVVSPLLFLSVLETFDFIEYEGGLQAVFFLIFLGPICFTTGIVGTYLGFEFVSSRID